jgi:hypothetical protein
LVEESDGSKHEELEASIMELTQALGNHNWFLDSRASEHITSDSNKLDITRKNSVGGRVRAAGNEPHAVQARGSATFSTKKGEIKLSNVLYVPSISKNFVSVGALTNEGKVVVFSKTHSLILDNLKGRNILAIGRRQRSNGLYKLTSEPKANLVSLEDLSRIWHQPLEGNSPK